MRLVLATANPDKAEEIRVVLHDAGVDVDLVPRPVGVPEVDETGETLEENARLKAVALCDATGLPAVADDTGLSVDALFGAPGVYSARFAGEDATYADNVAKLLRELRDVPAPERTARFTTVALARWPDGREVAAIGDVEGTIGGEARGDGGFGYDPLFVPVEGDGRTFAEMTAAEKHRVSHRGRAFRTLADGLKIVQALDLKDHAVEHGFHVHDERHFVESYSLRQNWEVDLHPEEGCEGPVDLYLSLEIDPRVLLGFEDAVIERADVEDPPDEFHFPLNFTWALPPLPHDPDLLVLATDLAGRGGPDLPLEVSAIDSIPAATDAPERSLRIVAHQSVSLLHIRDGDAVSCEVLDRCLDVSRYLLECAGDWLG
jgi:XTP/dITP diphosphohydrolase